MNVEAWSRILGQFCEFCGCENECEWAGQEKDRIGHMDECRFVEVNCPDRCGMTMERGRPQTTSTSVKSCLELERQRQSMDLLSQCDSFESKCRGNDYHDGWRCGHDCFSKGADQISRKCSWRAVC